MIGESVPASSHEQQKTREVVSANSYVLVRSISVKMLALFQRILDWFKSLFWKEEMELTLVGLQYSGKTTFVNVIAVSISLSLPEFLLVSPSLDKWRIAISYHAKYTAKCAPVSPINCLSKYYWN